MSFDSLTFWLFFTAVWVAWRRLPFDAAKTSALVASLVFYAWWNPWFLFLIVFSVVVDFFVGGKIYAAPTPRVRKAWLIVSLTTNLGLLAIFKYGPFAAENASSLAALFGLALDLELADWIIPVGISFYTFQTLSYSLDIYRGQLRPCDSFRDFFLFVVFFPQLVAGPIVRARELLPQLERRQRISPVHLRMGLESIIVGLFLKVVIADNLAPAVQRAFTAASEETLTSTGAWLGVTYFSVQIFADFAGYSGIAIGLAHLMGLRFPENFAHPYISRSLSEFWTRWHISLSQWLRDYLYIPLGGNRVNRARVAVNLMVTMLLGGLWHGAAWTFLAWGGLHGLGLCVERYFSRGGLKVAVPSPAQMPIHLARMLLVYIFVLTTWVFFRAESFEHASQFLSCMYILPFTGEFGFEELGEARHLVLVAPVFVMHLGRLMREWRGWRRTVTISVIATVVMLFLLTIIRRDFTQQFLYFQF